MATAPLVAAVFALASVLTTGVFLGLRALGTWRTFRRFTRAAGDAVDRVTRSAAEAEQHATAAAAGAEHLTVASRRLQASVAQLALLQAAAGELKATLARVRGVVPTK